MVNRFKLLVKEHIRNNLFLYIVIILTFILGVAAGSYFVRGLTLDQESELLNYLDMFLKGLSDLDVEPWLMAQHAVFNNLKIIILIWFLGLTVIGVPFIILIIFARGFIMGFTIAFLVQQKSAEGILITLLGIVPPNLINLPVAAAGSVFAVSFSYWILKGRRNDTQSVVSQLIGYTAVMAIIALISVSAGFVEAYISPTFLKLISDLKLS